MPDLPHPCEVRGDVYRDEVVVQMTDDSWAVCSLEGGPLGPRVHERVNPEWSSLIFALHPAQDILVVAQFTGAITVYNWRTGQQLWHRKEEFKKIHRVEFCNEHTLLVQQSTGKGKAIEVADVGSGDIVAQVHGVRYDLHADSLAPCIVLLRTIRSRRVLEIRRSLAEEPYVVRAAGADNVLSAAFGDGWVALTENETGSILMLDVESGQDRWTYQPEPDLYFLCLSRAPDSSWLFGLKQGKRRGYPPRGVLFDPSSGHVVKEEEVPLDYSSTAVVANGTIIACAKGLLHLPDMTWTPRDFGRSLPPG